MSQEVRTLSRKGKCATCKENEAVYTCPGCFINSCSLNCIKKHKVEKSCNGQRDKSAFVPIQEFNENHLLSDYRFLEEINHMNQSAQRGRQDEVMPTVIGKRRQVQIIATRHKLIEYQMLPPGFERMKKNKTSMNKRTIMWTVELQFVQSGVMFFEYSVNENTMLSKILSNYLDPASCDPIKRQRIKMYIQAGGLEKVKVLIQSKPFKELEKRGYHILDMNKSLSDNLVGMYIVEYPTLIVILAEKLSDYKIVENQSNLKGQERNSRLQQRNNSRGHQKRHRGGKPDKNGPGEKKAKIDSKESDKKEETDEKKDSLETQTKSKNTEKESEGDIKEESLVEGDTVKKDISLELSGVKTRSADSSKAEKEIKDLKQKETTHDTNANNESHVNDTANTSEITTQDKKTSDGNDE